MRVACAALILVLSAPLASAGVAVQSDVAFEVPAQLDGNTVVQGSWVLAYVEAGALDLRGSTALRLTNHTVTYVGARQVGSLHESHGYPVPSSESREVPGVDTAMHAQAGAAFWVKAKHVTVTLRGSSTLGATAAGAGTETLSSMGREAAASARSHPIGAPVAYLGAQGVEARVEASGVEAVEWAGFSAACGCLPGGGRHASGAEAGGASAGNVAYSSIELLGVLERSAFAGQVAELYVGGPWLEVAVEGSARLPLASPAADCPRCMQTQNRTLWAEGRLELADLFVRDGRTLGATFRGELVATRLDERPVDPYTVAGVPLPAAVALGVVGGVAGSVVLFLGLLTRFSRERALSNPNRRCLFEAIVASPGIPFRELVRHSGVATGTARYHLTVLVRAGLVAEKSHRNHLRFYENHGRFEATWAQVGLLREEPLRQLHGWMQSAGPLPQKDILTAWEMRGWSRSTTQHRLHRLAQDGLVQVAAQGRYKVYRAAPLPAPRHSYAATQSAAPSA